MNPVFCTVKSSYVSAMPDWIHKPESIYVIAAYGVALVSLIGLIAATWAGARRAAKAADMLQDRRGRDRG